GVAVDRAQPIGAHRAGALALRAVHPEIGDQRVMPAEQVLETDLGAVGVPEAVVLCDDRAGRQGAPLRREPRHVAAELDLLGEQRFASLAIVSAFAGEWRLGRPG